MKFSIRSTLHFFIISRLFCLREPFANSNSLQTAYLFTTVSGAASPSYSPCVKLLVGLDLSINQEESTCRKCSMKGIHYEDILRLCYVLYANRVFHSEVRITPETIGY